MNVCCYPIRFVSTSEPVGKRTSFRREGSIIAQGKSAADAALGRTPTRILLPGAAGRKQPFVSNPIHAIALACGLVTNKAATPAYDTLRSMKCTAALQLRGDA